MAERIPKPRRTKGTVAHRTRNYFALGVLAIGTVYGLIFHYSSPAQTLLESVKKGKFAATEEELDRKGLMSVVLKQRGETIEKLIEEKKDMESH